MENATSAIITFAATKPLETPALAVLRRCGELLVERLRGMGAAWCDPMTCSAFWIGGIPAMWDVRK